MLTAVLAQRVLICHCKKIKKYSDSSSSCSEINSCEKRKGFGDTSGTGVKALTVPATNKIINYIPAKTRTMGHKAINSGSYIRDLLSTIKEDDNNLLFSHVASGVINNEMVP